MTVMKINIPKSSKLRACLVGENRIRISIDIPIPLFACTFLRLGIKIPWGMPIPSR